MFFIEKCNRARFDNIILQYRTHLFDNNFMHARWFKIKFMTDLMIETNKSITDRLETAFYLKKEI